MESQCVTCPTGATSFLNEASVSLALVCAYVSVYMP